MEGCNNVWEEKDKKEDREEEEEEEEGSFKVAKGNEGSTVVVSMLWL